MSIISASDRQRFREAFFASSKDPQNLELRDRVIDCAVDILFKTYPDLESYDQETLEHLSFITADPFIESLEPTIAQAPMRRKQVYWILEDALGLERSYLFEELFQERPQPREIKPTILSQEAKPQDTKLSVHYHPSELKYITPYERTISDAARQLPDVKVQRQLWKGRYRAKVEMRGEGLELKDFGALSRAPSIYPITERADGTLNGNSFGVAHAQGRREAMEDEHVACLCTAMIQGKEVSFPLFVVIDGHGGDATARFLKAHFQEEVQRAISKYCASGVSATNVKLALREAFMILDDRAVKEVPKEKSGRSSGAVAIASIQIGSDIFVANLGDPRAVIILKYGEAYRAVQLSQDMRLDLDRFKRKVGERGGTVEEDAVGTLRANGYEPARAFNDGHVLGKEIEGDCFFVLSPKCDVFQVHVPQLFSEQFNIEHPNPSRCKIALALVCDGVTEVFSSRNIGQQVVEAHMDPKKSADSLVENAVKSGSYDNCTACVGEMKMVTIPEQCLESDLFQKKADACLNDEVLEWKPIPEFLPDHALQMKKISDRTLVVRWEVSAGWEEGIGLIKRHYMAHLEKQEDGSWVMVQSPYLLPASWKGWNAGAFLPEPELSPPSSKKLF